MRPLDYASELTQSLIVGVILAGIFGGFIFFTGFQIGNIDPNLVTIVVMFTIGVISVWWAFFKLKGKSFIGV